MLVTLSSILEKAEKGKYAVIAPDFTTMNTVRHILESAESNHAPVILSYHPSMESLSPIRSWEKWIQLIREECEQYECDICLHLDHGNTFTECKKVIDEGFTGVMIDASDKSFDENIDLTRKVVEYAHSAGVSVEAEIGHVGTAEDDCSIDGDSTLQKITQPDQAYKFSKDTEIDALAVAVGTVHGNYKGEPNINFEILSDIDKKVSIPLVMHGGSGTGDGNIRKSVSLGIRKVNVFTDWVLPVHRRTAQILKDRGATDAIQANQEQKRIIDEVLSHWFEITSSKGKG